jgi:hypothetical protein
LGKKKFLKQKENPCNISKEARTSVWGRKLGQQKRQCGKEIFLKPTKGKLCRLRQIKGAKTRWQIFLNFNKLVFYCLVVIL